MTRHLLEESKRSYARLDLQRQAREANAALRWPSGFPVNTVTALRVTLLAAEQVDSAALTRLIHRFFQAVWVDDQDPQDPGVVRVVCDSVGLDGADLLMRAGTPPAKQALFDATAEALRAGVFGAPTFAVQAEGYEPALFWGNDRLELAHRAATGDDRVLRASDAP